VLGLVWTASRILTIGLAIATVLAGIVPAVTAYVAKLLIDAVVGAISAHAAGSDAVTPVGPLLLDSVGKVVLLAVAQFAIYALT
jgi:uncharacterized membrane protein